MTKLGQHFLKSPSIARRIANSAEITSEDFVFEIGPGKGVLTRELLKKARKVIALEKDIDLFKKLQIKFKKEIEEEKLVLIEGDILETDLEKIRELPKNYKLVANIPYYITGKILRKFLSSKKHPSSISILVQKEVAERIKSEKGSLLAISVKTYGDVEYVEKIKKSCFSPPPKVDSALIKISNISKENFESIDEKLFFKILKTGFAHPRKKLVSNLSVLEEKQKIENLFKELNISEKSRPEDLNTKDWLKLTQKITEFQ